MVGIRERNTEKMRRYAQRRFFWSKATKLRGEDAATFLALARLWKEQRGLCAITGRRLDRTAEIDHRLPRARGGGDNIANLQWVTREANRAKRDLTDAEFVALCSDVMRWVGRRIEMVEALTSLSMLEAAE
jgi:5-methylcytosine-specific restriction endonuclease McrA